MMTRFGWMWMLAGLAVVASAAGPKTFRMPDSVLLFGNYNEIRIVTAEGERLVRPPVDVKFNGGYFAFPSLAPSGEFVVWGFATESHVAWPDVRIHFALGVYSIAQQRWKTYGDFETIGDASISPDAAKIAWSRENEKRRRANVLTGRAPDEFWRRVESQGTSFPLVDKLGSTLALTDSAGSTVTQYIYEPFSRTQASGTINTNAAQFTGRENDGQPIGLYFYRARYLSVGAHRFIAEDPIEFDDCVNRYIYAHSSPTNFVDPTGLKVGGTVIKLVWVLCHRER
jgi:RHS repeat-associated protein